ncbi:MAG: hypothetical protein AW12_01763 [Candidatus Accumulibacter sp. BA-94]|nr:MAG: hypothetical protein AW12_01763 [Candidatus Accumulibacter sp. BA-94]
MDRLRFRLLRAHAGKEGGHRRQPAQDQERRADRRRSSTSGGFQVTRVNQLLDPRRRTLRCEQRVRNDFLQFLDFDLNEVGGTGAGGGNQVVRAAGEARRPQSPPGVVVAKRHHVLVVNGQLALGPRFEMIRKMHVVGIDDAAQAIPSAARQNLAKPQLGGQYREFPGEHCRACGGRDSRAQSGDLARQFLPR